MCHEMQGKEYEYLLLNCCGINHCEIDRERMLLGKVFGFKMAAILAVVSWSCTLPLTGRPDSFRLDGV